MNGHTTNQDLGETSGFVLPPNNSADSIFVHDLKTDIWLPSLYIPQLLKEPLDDDETPVTMFSYRDLSFLLFFRGQHNNSRIASELLSLLENRLSEFCGTYASNENESISTQALFAGEPGMDIIYVDRQDNSFLLLSQYDLSSNNFRRKANTTSPNDNNNNNLAAKGLFGIGFKIKENCEREKDVTSTVKSTYHMNLLDCRHKLAAHLPLDVMLAFDDMFNEIGRLSCRQNILKEPQLSLDERNYERNDYRKRTVELCTYLPQGWVYGRACESRELYVLLDTNLFVTISDVTKAVSRVRERMLNDKLL
jgi:hypothetical protein